MKLFLIIFSSLLPCSFLPSPTPSLATVADLISGPSIPAMMKCSGASQKCVGYFSPCRRILQLLGISGLTLSSSFALSQFEQHNHQTRPPLSLLLLRYSRNVWTKLLPLDLKDRYTALLGVPESHLLDDGVYTCQVLINSCI